jgi:hypothetical protein
VGIDMSSRIFMRGAAVVTLLMAVGHLFGSPWTPAASPQGHQVVEAMQAYRFDAMGLERSYYDFYVGFGWLSGAYLVGHAILFWQIASLSIPLSAQLRPVVVVLCVEAVCATLLEWKFLFWVPVALSGLTAVCLGAAWLLMRRTK